jgi:3-dehydrosphinganine reductase
VSSERQVSEAIARLVAEAGLPDLVINSAGITHPGYVQELSLDIFREMMEVNYFGTVYVTKAVLPGMLERGSGHIVNIASLAGVVGVFGYTAYGASKYAVRGFTDALRAEVKGLGIDVSIVFPPDTDTPQLAYENEFKPPETKALSNLNSILPPDKVARAILDGIRRRRYVILPSFDSKLTYWLVSLAGTLAYPAMDWLVARARRRIR